MFTWTCWRQRTPKLDAANGAPTWSPRVDLLDVFNVVFNFIFAFAKPKNLLFRLKRNIYQEQKPNFRKRVWKLNKNVNGPGLFSPPDFLVLVLLLFNKIGVATFFIAGWLWQLIAFWVKRKLPENVVGKTLHLFFFMACGGNCWSYQGSEPVVGRWEGAVPLRSIPQPSFRWNGNQGASFWSIFWRRSYWCPSFLISFFFGSLQTAVQGNGCAGTSLSPRRRRGCRHGVLWEQGKAGGEAVG